MGQAGEHSGGVSRALKVPETAKHDTAKLSTIISFFMVFGFLFKVV
jgi:hypothetical protein